MTETNDNGKSMRASHPHSDHALHERIQSEYREMPGMRLTAQQAARLFNLEVNHCARVLEALVTNGFLWTNGREFHASTSGRRFA